MIWETHKLIASHTSIDYLKRTNFHVYIFLRILRILVDFAKLNTREILSDIHENIYTSNMDKTQLINSAFFRVNQ